MKTPHPRMQQLTEILEHSRDLDTRLLAIRLRSVAHRMRFHAVQRAVDEVLARPRLSRPTVH